MNDPSFIEKIGPYLWTRLALLLPKRLLFYVGLRMWAELSKDDASNADWEEVSFADVINFWII